MGSNVILNYKLHVQIECASVFCCCCCLKVRGIPEIVIEELVNIAHYTPSSQLSSSSFMTETKCNKPKPPSIPELTKCSVRNEVNNCGRILGKSKGKPMNWQTVGCMWDKIQERRETPLSQR